MICDFCNGTGVGLHWEGRKAVPAPCTNCVGIGRVYCPHDRDRLDVIRAQSANLASGYPTDEEE